MTLHLHRYDLPADLSLSGDLAVDTETLGLSTRRDRLCLVQLADAQGAVHLVHFPTPDYAAPQLKALLADKRRCKLMHYARFDMAAIETYLGVKMTPVFCTKIASRLTRTYTDRHGLRDLCRELLDLNLDKQQQSSDWGAAELSSEQQNYAANDVRYLHALRDILTARLAREQRSGLAEACFAFLPHRVALDLAGWPESDLFAHS